MRRAFLLALLLALPAFAQETKDATAAIVIQSSIAAVGGSNLAAVNDTVATVEVTARKGDDSSTRAATIKTLGPKRLRFDTPGADGTSTFVVNGAKTAQRSKSGRIKRVPEPSVGNGGITHIPLLSCLADWSDDSVQVEYLGLQKAGDGASVHKVRLRRRLPKDHWLGEYAPPCDISIDATTLLVLSIEYSMHPPDDLQLEERVEVRYGDYKAFGGLLLPTTVSRFVRGQLITTQRLISFDVNTGSSEADFELQ
jgi:hypothetical protein